MISNTERKVLKMIVQVLDESKSLGFPTKHPPSWSYTILHLGILDI